MAFNDATCPKCHRRFGWAGLLENCPPCPGCGYQIPPEEFKKVEEEMRAAEEAILKKREKKRTLE